MSLPPRPLILTLGLDDSSQALFERERRLYFPARLNRIPAHLSLFHALPGEELGPVCALLEKEANRPAFSLEVYDLVRLGRGVAYALRAPELSHLHTVLRLQWLPWLTPQDQQPFRPHIVVQNKVQPQEAQQLYGKLATSFRPSTVTAASLLLWHYEGGPWAPAGVFPFHPAGAAE